MSDVIRTFVLRKTNNMRKTLYWFIFIWLVLLLCCCTSAKKTVSTVNVETVHSSAVITKIDSAQYASHIQMVTETAHIDSVAHIMATQGDSMEDLTEWERITERFDSVAGTTVTEKVRRLLRKCYHASQSHETATHNSQDGGKVIQSVAGSVVAGSIAVTDSAHEKFVSSDSVYVQKYSGERKTFHSFSCAILICTLIVFFVLSFIVKMKR